MRLQALKRTLVSAVAVSGMLGVASQAHALTIMPSSPSLVYTTNATPAIDADGVESALASVFINPGQLGEAYKQNEGGGESGTAMSYYTTTFLPTFDPSGAEIKWDGSYFIECGDCYLVVKDGNHTPALYIFDISSWNGQDTLDLSGFWMDQGTISYVAIYNNASMDGGGTIAAIPEADTYAMLLAGLGLVGFAARRKIARTA